MKRSSRASLLLALGVVFTTCFTRASTSANPNQDGVQASPSPQQSDARRYFPETGQTVEGAFLRYWEANGGLAQFGYPISGNISERSSVDGNEYSMQYFERAVFEYHPEYRGTPYEVLLSLLGTFAYKQKYPDGAPGQKPSTDHPLRFEQTGKTLGGVFRTYWETHRGLARQGYPISDEFQERSPLNGKTYTMQYFERAVFEYHPEYKGTPYEVLLSLLGTFAYKGGKDGNETESSLTFPPLASNRNRYIPVGSDRYLVWTEFTLGSRPGQSSPYTEGSYDIMGLDLKTGASIIVSNARCDQRNASISGSMALWATFNPRGGRSHLCGDSYAPLPDAGDWDVVGKDLDTGIMYDIATGPGDQSVPPFAGKTVLWLEGDHEYKTLLAKDLDTGTATQIRSGLGLTPIAISDDYIVWSEPGGARSSSGAEIVLVQAYNRHTFYISEIARSQSMSSYALDRSHFAWFDGKLHAIDLNTGETHDIDTDTQQVSQLVMRNGYVIWAAPREGSRFAHDIFGATWKEYRVVPLVTNQGNNMDPTIAGKWLVWDQVYGNSVTTIMYMPLADAFASSSKP